jgi:phage baseplate assembly protein W
MTTLTDLIGVDIAHKSDFLLSADGDLDTISGLDNIKIALFHRLITSPGSLIHRPTYGVGIQDFQNAVNSIANQREIANRIQEQYEQDPRVEAVTGVRIDNDDLTPEKVVLLVKVKVRGYDEVEMEFIPFGE